MYIMLKTAFYEFLISLIETLPTVDPFQIPDTVKNGLVSIFGFVGWLMPYEIYSPLLTFILALTAFRIAWAIFITFKK